MLKVTSTLPFTRAQLRAKLLRDDLCAINALVQLLQKTTDLPERAFLISLRDQAVWNRRDHERGIALSKPLLSAKQLFYLRRLLTETYLDDLYEIATERVGPVAMPAADEAVTDADATVSECYCHLIPGGDANDPVLCSHCDNEIWTSSSWFCTVCDGLAVIEHCGLRYCRGCYDEKRNAEAQTDPYDLRHLRRDG